MTSCFPFLHTHPFWKSVYSKWKEFAPTGSKLFPFRVDPFSKGRQNNFDTVTSLESVSIPLKWITWMKPAKSIWHKSWKFVVYEGKGKTFLYIMYNAGKGHLCHILMPYMGNEGPDQLVHTCSLYRALTLVMLNKLRCHTHFQFSANQINWSRLLI